MITPPSASIQGATVANPPLGNGRITLGGATPNHSTVSFLLAANSARTEFRSCLALATCIRYLGGPPCIMTSSCAAAWETPQRTDSTACECAKLSRAGGLRGTTELQHTYVLTSHKPGIYSPAPNTNATMDTANVCKAIESPIKSHASLVVSPSRHGLRHP